MIKDEIIAGLKNAMVRGQSLEQAMQSFINAGYNLKDVQAAGAEISGIVQSQSPNSEPSPAKREDEFKKLPLSAPNEALTQNKNYLPKLPALAPIKEKNWGGETMIITAIIVLFLIFAGVLGYLIYYLAT